MSGPSTERPFYEPCGEAGMTSCIIAAWIWKVVPVLLLTIGTIGNILSLIVLSRKQMLQYSSTVYLLFLAGDNLLTLWGVQLRWALVYVFNIDILILSDFLCMFIFWCDYTIGLFGMWLVVLLTIERTIYVKWPIFAREKMTKAHAVMACLVTLLVLAVVNGHFFIGMRLVTTPYATNATSLVANVTCGASGEFYTTFRRDIWPTVFLLGLYTLLPLAIITGGNLTIGCVLLKKRRLRIQCQNTRPTENSDKQMRATRLLLIICISFVITTTPFLIFEIIYGATVKSHVSDASFADFQLAYALVVMIVYCHHALTFFLYITNGSLFKKEFINVVNETKSKLRQCFGITDNNQDNSAIDASTETTRTHT